MQIEPYRATVLVDGRQLTSAIDRVAEAQLQARLVPEDAEEAWLYGVGLGDLVRALLARPALRRLHVCVLSAELRRRIPADLSDPRIEVHAPGEVTEMACPWAVVPTELRLTDAAALPLRDRVMAALNMPYNNLFFEQLRPLWAKQREENADLIAGGRRVTETFGTDHRDAVVVAGGPTATESLSWLWQHFDHQVIAVSRAIKPLLAADVPPDVVVHLDRGPKFGAPLFPEGHPPALARTALALVEESEPVIPRRWPGPIQWMNEEDLMRGGSVLHAAVDLAVQRGARTVHLLGADLCFPAGKAHLAGAPGDTYVTAAPGQLRTLNGLGQWVTTQESMVQYHRALEEYVAVTPHVRFIKHGRAGVPVRGAEWADAL